MDEKKTLVILQWAVVIGTSYFLLFSKGAGGENLWVLTLITVLLASVLVLQHLPAPVFEQKFFPHAVVVVDTLLISLGIGLNQESSWDLFLLFFFGLFIAAIGESMIQIVMGCLVLSIIFVVLSLFQGKNPPQMESDLLLRVPFFFGSFLIYGYLAERAKKEKGRAEKAEEAERLKRQLVSALAHDIKNPLAIIMGYAETVASRLEGFPESQEILESLERIQSNAQRIVNLVTGFLDASRLEAGKIQMIQQPVQLNLLIREVGQQQMGDVRKKDLALNVDLDDRLPEVMGDEAQLHRVLWNLLGNAVKFTLKGGKITVASRWRNGHVYVSVTDTGMGIPQDEMRLLFSEFRRLSGTAKIEGTGLGLFIVKTLVEAHGGSVGVESKVGQGSTFTICLPART
ncbi:MAG: HAMP domain-containing histidine kinase [Deltaproteobacteria bacterium]|nr:HAMP domain-containing histidine kinase [Deltaproteobacteria bacterium]